MFKALSDAELVGHIQSTTNDQRAWREVINRVEKPLRNRVYDYMGSTAKHEDVEDAVQYAIIEFRRRLLIVDIDVFTTVRLGKNGEQLPPVSLAAFAKKAGAATGVRAVRRDQYGPDYETIIVPAITLDSLVNIDKVEIAEAAERVGVTVERAKELLLELAAVPTPLDPEFIEESDSRRGRSAEEAYENTPAAMSDALIPILPSPEVRAYVVRLAGSREHIGEGAEGHNVRKALGIDEREYDRSRKSATRETMRFFGASNVTELSDHRDRAAAIIRGEVSA